VDVKTTAVIARREFRDALRNKWLILFALCFALLALALSGASLSTAGYSGLGGFGRTAASLINALLLFVPLLGLTVGASVLPRERERGTLAYLLAQPVNRAEVFFGLAAGNAVAVLIAIMAGYGLAGVLLAASGGDNPSAFLALAGYSALLALVASGIGFLIGAVARKTASATGVATIVWLLLVFLSDLGAIAVTLAWRPTVETLFVLLVVNPLQIFKLGAVLSLRSTLDVLGAVGQYAYFELGDRLAALLAGLLCAWIVAAFGASYVVFARRGDV
jgi:Cu-processing system permease protein